jgi:hypothetical protein
MPGFLATMKMDVTCAHDSPAKPLTSNTHVKLGGEFAPEATTVMQVTACPHEMGALGPRPCVMAVYDSSSLTKRVKSNGQGLIVEDSMTQLATVVQPATPVPLKHIKESGQARVRAQ